ncbi:hypothetical protein [Endothiovibrio diazotrophicus]
MTTLLSLDAADKPWWQSKTLIGIAVAALAHFAPDLGLEIDPQGAEYVVQQGVAGIGALLAAWGRLSAKGALTR